MQGNNFGLYGFCLGLTSIQRIIEYVLIIVYSFLLDNQRSNILEKNTWLKKENIIMVYNVQQ